ncbi:unnamed protein product [Prorocentrum cordatum]|uniref:Uncharacterized protein n=1 Tax=Prorocentrum cordatum TaxID=2364126 RepID=A0ABN9TXG9_9DINO|nr:unnamed protein product [Polarella glacialis]
MSQGSDLGVQGFADPSDSESSDRGPAGFAEDLPPVPCAPAPLAALAGPVALLEAAPWHSWLRRPMAPMTATVLAAAKKRPGGQDATEVAEWRRVISLCIGDEGPRHTVSKAAEAKLLDIQRKRSSEMIFGLASTVQHLFSVCWSSLLSRLGQSDFDLMAVFTGLRYDETPTKMNVSAGPAVKVEPKRGASAAKEQHSKQTAKVLQSEVKLGVLFRAPREKPQFVWGYFPFQIGGHGSRHWRGAQGGVGRCRPVVAPGGHRQVCHQVRGHVQRQGQQQQTVRGAHETDRRRQALPRTGLRLAQVMIDASRVPLGPSRNQCLVYVSRGFTLKHPGWRLAANLGARGRIRNGGGVWNLSGFLGSP